MLGSPSAEFVRANDVDAACESCPRAESQARIRETSNGEVAEKLLRIGGEASLSRAAVRFRRSRTLFKRSEALFETRELRVVGVTHFVQRTILLGNFCLECLDRG